MNEVPAAPAPEQDNNLKWIGLAILIILIIVIVGFFIFFVVRLSSKSSEITIRDEVVNAEEDTDLAEIGLPIELDPMSNKAYFSLFCVPAVQPTPETAEAKKYGGAHMTLFPSQLMPKNYSIVNAMNGFAMNQTQWNLGLPGITTKVKNATSKNLVLMMIYGASTINTLRTYLQTSAGGGWTKPWSSNHVTLGTIDPDDQYTPSDFTKQPLWYIQLVRNPGHHWDPSERVALYVAQGHNN